MKRIILILYCFMICISCSSKDYYVKENFNSMNFEICTNDEVIYELPFGKFCGYQLLNNNMFFIDCSKSNIFEYGEICYFDCNLRQLLYTGLFSGSSFYITDDSKFLIATSLLESHTESDIVDIFGLGMEIKKYPLIISVYNFTNSKKLQDFSFSEKLDMNHLENYYVKITPVTNDEIQIIYGIYDSSFKIDCGIIKLRDFQ